MIQQDSMMVKIETVGGFFQSGIKDGVRIHDHGIIREISINFPETGAKGRLAEGADLEAIFDHAICRAETMVRNLKKMKSEHLEHA